MNELHRVAPALLKEIGRLHCPPKYGVLLPDVSIGAGVGRSEKQRRSISPDEEGGRVVETAGYVAIGLTWTLRPASAMECENQRQLRSVQLDQRMKRLREVVLMRERLRDELAACSKPHLCALWQVELEKQQALIDSLTGH